LLKDDASTIETWLESSWRTSLEWVETKNHLRTSETMPSHYQAQDLEKERGEVQRSGAWVLRVVVPFQNQPEQFTAIALYEA
jgi:hypothetical protein